MNEETEELNITNVATLFALLKTCFADPDTTSTARYELHQLRQEKGDFATYHAEFTCMVRKLRFNDQAK